MHFALDLPEGQVVSGGGKVAISPDGTRLAYVSGRQIWLRSLGSVEITPVAPATPTAAIVNLTFSPDGQWLVYTNPRDIFRVPAAGGLPVRVHSLDTVPLGMTWTEDSLLIALANKIIRVGANGGDTETLVELPEDQRAVRPELLPDGQTLLFGMFSTGGGTQTRPIPDIVVQRIGEQARTVLVTNADDAVFVAPGYLLFAREGVLYGAGFDPVRPALSKDAVPILPGVRRNGPYAQYALSATGILAYIAGPLEVAPNPGRFLILAARDGTREYLTPGSGNFSEPRLSPDGRYVAYVNQEETVTSIWVYDLQGGGAARRLTFVGKDRAPVWTPDSTRLTFQSERDGTTAIYTQRVDGRGVAEQLTKPESGVTHTPQAWSPDGKTLLLDAKDKTRFTLMIMRSEAKALSPFADVNSVSETGATFSPDGRWVAYTRDEIAAPAMVFVQPFPATGALFQISKSTEDGHHPIWARDGKELLYTPGGGFISVPMRLSPEIVPGEPVQRPRPFTNLAPSQPRSYDSADAGKILGLTTEARDTAPVQGTAAPVRVKESIQIIVNWMEELKAKVRIQ
jgi:Tol biopolymer transport system component